MVGFNCMSAFPQTGKGLGIYLYKVCLITCLVWRLWNVPLCDRCKDKVWNTSLQMQINPSVWSVTYGLYEQNSWSVSSHSNLQIVSVSVSPAGFSRWGLQNLALFQKNKLRCTEILSLPEQVNVGEIIMKLTHCSFLLVLVRKKSMLIPQEKEGGLCWPAPAKTFIGVPGGEEERIWGGDSPEVSAGAYPHGDPGSVSQPCRSLRSPLSAPKPHRLHKGREDGWSAACFAMVLQ